MEIVAPGKTAHLADGVQIEPFGTLWHKQNMAEAQRNSARKDSQAFGLQELIGAHGDRLLRSAFLLCGNETEAQDLVQETFLQALKSAQRFRRESTLYTWLHGILLNLCRRHIRKQKRLIFEEKLVLKATVQSSSTHEGDQAYCADKLAQAVQRLSPEHREVIVLRYYEDLKIQEIADRTGASTGTVKSRLHYAMRCLEQFLPPELNLFVSEDTHTQTK